MGRCLAPVRPAQIKPEQPVPVMLIVSLVAQSMESVAITKRIQIVMVQEMFVITALLIAIRFSLMQTGMEWVMFVTRPQVVGQVVLVTSVSSSVFPRVPQQYREKI